MENNNVKVVIMAGGKGTRIAGISSNNPKPMLSIHGKPILEWQIECLKKLGFTEIILVIGYKGHIIQDYFGDGSKFYMHIEYITETEPLGTAGSLYFLKKKITKDFLLLNGDLIFDVDINRFVEYHMKSEAVVTLFTHPNDHPYDSGIIVADRNHRVHKWLHKEDNREWYKNRVNAGLHMISPKLFKQFKYLKKLDLDRDILEPMIPTGTLFCYDSPEYVKDIGTPERFYEVEGDIKSGKLEKKNLNTKQKAVFLDRDGTINKYVGFLKNINDFELITGVAELIRKINSLGYLVIVVTNQPVIARGEVTWEELNEIHDKMETLLGQQGAYLDDIFICPHHPDKGFEGEKIEYKIICDCRKPKPGMLLQAAEKYNIDLSHSYIIGDSESDIQAGRAAGCKVFRYNQDRTFLDFFKSIVAD